jgi:hypothetical protein
MSELADIALGVSGELGVIAFVLGGMVLLFRLLDYLDASGKDGGSGGGGPRGGEDRPPPHSPDEGGDFEPAWWPRFEREFADYVKRSRRRRRLRRAGP